MDLSGLQRSSSIKDGETKSSSHNAVLQIFSTLKFLTALKDNFTRHLGSSSLNQLTLTRNQMETMRAHVESCVPLEACGLLAGKDARVRKILIITNREHSPVMFRMEPVEQIRAFDWIEANGLELVGIFHSHPAGPETLSATDIAEVAYEVVQIIWSRSNFSSAGSEGPWLARGFWVENGRSFRVNLQITNDE